MTRYLDRAVSEPGLRLFCFHHVGGGDSLFRGWQQALHPHATVCPVLLPGRERRAAEPCRTDMAELVADLDDQLDEYLTGPHLFFGHSMGAEIAYRLACRRHRAGRTAPRALLVSGCAAPGLPLALPLTGGLDDATLIRLLTDLGGMPAQLLECSPLLAAMLPVIRDDLRLCAGDRDSAGPALPCPIHIFGGDADPMVDEFDLAAWRGHTIGHSTVRTFPGGHFYLVESSDELFGHLRSLLRRYARAEASLPC
ncbi:alpha/beta fold hydrolase [Nocardia yamanashiensis]|uniref:thioesterase II family protein n=1 Tax=Nocardia yamanashiensis TaxID=209247 RepID=UPI001E5B0E56|nr:alpha/beta fold hydrolase [Nocardia yamanashiensis]UGT44212.1 alpha/beta fold hydrolase [Nocardia yamanashiensis]